MLLSKKWMLKGVTGECNSDELPSHPSPSFPPEAVVEAQLAALRWVGMGANKGSRNIIALRVRLHAWQACAASTEARRRWARQNAAVPDALVRPTQHMPSVWCMGV